MDEIIDKFERIRREGREFQKEVRTRAVGYIVGALGLVVGLAWNEAIKTLIEQLVPVGQDTLLAQFLYAAGMTMVLVLVTVYLLRQETGKKD